MMSCPKLVPVKELAAPQILEQEMLKWKGKTLELGKVYISKKIEFDCNQSKE